MSNPFAQTEPKKSNEELIQHMKSLGIKFNITDESTALKILNEKTYYYRLKGYAKNYSRDANGQYKNLEFAYLEELSTLDMHFRRLVLQMAIDVEHSIKHELINSVIAIKHENGYNIVAKFLQKNTRPQEALRKRKSEKKFYGHDILSKYMPSNNDFYFAVWNFTEVITLGDFFEFYAYCNKTYFSNKLQLTKNALWSIKKIRNATAHNNCLFEHLSFKQIKNTFEITVDNYLKKKLLRITNLREEQVIKNLKFPMLHDFITLLNVYLFKMPAGSGKSNCLFALKDFFNTQLFQKNYFVSNQEIMARFCFMRDVVQAFLNNAGKGNSKCLSAIHGSP